MSKFLANIEKKLLIYRRKIMGYEFVRCDRGALEFVAKKEWVWPNSYWAAFADYKSICWPSKQSMNDLHTLRHELSHLEDDRKLGFIFSRMLYTIFNILFTYEKNPFEIKAKKAEEIEKD